MWREPAEKRETDAVLDPRRAAVARRSRPSDPSRPRLRASDRSSETLFNLLRSDYALEGMSAGPAPSFSSERRGFPSHWNDMNALPTPVPDPERASLRVTLFDSEPRASRSGLRRMRSPVPVLRSETSRGSSASSELYTPRFPPAFAERERQGDEEPRRFRPPFAAAAESAAARRAADEGGPRFRFPARIPRYLADVVDENEAERRTGSYMTRSLHLPRFDIDGLGDRERSPRSTLTNLSLVGVLRLTDICSPDATQWELVANDLGFQAACDLWDTEESDGEGAEITVSDHLWDTTHDRDEAFRMRRLTSLFASQNRDMDRLAERL